MMHVAAEQIQEGDVVVAAVTADCSDGLLRRPAGHELPCPRRARPRHRRGVRDVKDLTAMASRCEQGHQFQGHDQGHAGLGECHVVCAGAVVNPGDVIVADDDGVVVVPAAQAQQTADAAAAREANEARSAPGWLPACWVWTCTGCASRWPRPA